jgi:hypothetical protein
MQVSLCWYKPVIVNNLLAHQWSNYFVIFISVISTKSYTIIQVVAWAELNSLCSRADWLPEFLPVLGSLPSRENPRVARGEAESLKEGSS